MADSDDESLPTLNVDFSGVGGTWCLAWLLMEDRELAMRATALNFVSTSEGLPKDWHKEAEKVLEFMRGEPKFKVVQLKAVPDDKSG